MEVSEHLDAIGELQKQKRFQEALEATETAQKQWPNASKLALQRGILLRQNARLEASESCLRECVKNHPKLLSVRIELAVTCRCLGQYAEAIKLLEGVLKTKPTLQTASLQLVETFRIDGQTERAIQTCEEAISVNPSSVALSRKLADLYKNKGEFSKSVDLLNRLRAAHPENRRVAIELLRSLKAGGQEDEADQLLQALKAEAPDHAGILLEEIDLALGKGDARAALQLSEQAVKKCPKTLSLALRRGAILQRLQLWSQAEEFYTKSTRVFPNSFKVKAELANVLRIMGKAEKALHLANEILAQNDADRIAIETKIILEGNSGNFEDALKWCQKLVALSPTSKSYRFCVDRLLLNQAADSALQLLQDKPNVDAHDATVGFLKVQALFQLNRHSEANDLLEKLVHNTEIASPDPAAILITCQNARRLDLCSTLATREFEKTNPDEGVVSFVFRKAGAHIALTKGAANDSNPVADMFNKCSPLTRVGILIERLEFEAAMVILRESFSKERPLAEAELVAKCLVGMVRLPLALRYLARCRHRWPNSSKIAKLLFDVYLKTGEIGKAEELFENLRAQKGSARRMLQNFKFQILMNDASTDALLLGEDFVDLPLHDRRRAFRHQLASGQAVDWSLVDRNAAAEWETKFLNHWNATFEGQLAIDATLLGDKGNMAQEESDYLAIKERLRSSPHSTVAALRLINGARRHIAAGTVTQANVDATAIPKVIYQYWDAPEAPQRILDFMRSWEDTTGYEHKRFDLQSAAQILRTEFGPKWLRAFRVANNPAEASDFLRMCLLAKFGGVYADADDVLYGDLDRLIGDRQGLVCYLESVGRAIGNNFIAVAPMHPVMVRAARLARNALLRGDNDTTWTKTGPGLFTRAVAVYLAQFEDQDFPSDVHILKMSDVTRHIAMHNRLPHKATTRHWKGVSAYQREIQPLVDLLEQKRTAKS